MSVFCHSVALTNGTKSTVEKMAQKTRDSSKKTKESVIEKDNAPPAEKVKGEGFAHY